MSHITLKVVMDSKHVNFCSTPVLDIPNFSRYPNVHILFLSNQYIPHVKEALMSSGLNVNPQQDGTSLFIQLPQ